MPDAHHARPRLVVIYPYKFHDFIYGLLELDQFKRYCDVDVWDVSPLMTPGFSRAVSAGRSMREGILVVASWWTFIRRIQSLRRGSASTNICVINEIPNNSFREFFANVVITALLRSKPVSIVDLYNGGLPLRGASGSPGSTTATSKPTLFARARRVIQETSSFREIAKTARGIVLATLSRRLPSSTTHRLVAGEDWESLARERSHGNARITLVAGHSNDFSNNLLHQLMVPASASATRTGVMLDGAGPMFGNDFALLGRKVPLTSDAWYPALTRLFDRLEAATGARIEIAGHYKTTHPPVAPYFGNRRVHYGKTRELVRASEFVITRASTAISYAVAHRKPIVLIYSNELAEDRRLMRQGAALAAMLDRTLVNIDALDDLDVNALLAVNEERYARYEKACLTSDQSGRPNVQIILEDVMKIPTSADLYRQDRQG